jgi:hypothetical protein
MQDDAGALRAWNQIGKPRVNRVRIDGLHHTRYQTSRRADGDPAEHAVDGRALRARAAAPRRAARSRGHALAVRPEADGFATVDVVVVELAERAGRRGGMGRHGARAAINREIATACRRRRSR